MLPLGKTTSAVSLNKKDGFCFDIKRVGSDSFNVCFDTEKQRNVLVDTIYAN